MSLRLLVCELCAEDGEVLGLRETLPLAVELGEGAQLRLAGRGTHKVRLGGLCELQLSGLANVGIWRAVSSGCKAGERGGRYTPGERVPSNTWLISMIAEGVRWRAGRRESGVERRVRLGVELVLGGWARRKVRFGEVAVGCRERI